MKRPLRGSLKLLGVHHPRKILILGLLLMAALASGLKQLYKDTRADAFLAADNPALVYKNKVRENFGLSDPLVIAIQDNSSRGVYRPETLTLVETLTTQIDSLDNINADRTISLATENNIVGTDDGMDVSPFYDLVQTPEAIRAAINDFPLYDGMLVSDDQAMTVIVAELISDDLAEQTYDQITAITGSAVLDEHQTLHIAGEGAVLGFLGHYIDRDASRLNPLAGVIITIMLAVAFHRFMPALLGNLVIGASVLMTLGFMAYNGVPFYVITNAMPVILIGMAVADSIHIFSHYYECQARNPEMSPRDCIEAAVKEMYRPVTLTTLTTMAGFLGLYAAAYMPPFEAFGLFTAFGVFIAWVYSVYVLPALITLLKPKVSKRWVTLASRGHSDLFSRGMAALGHLATLRPGATVVVFAGLAIVGVGLASKVQVNENRIHTFHPEEEIYQADQAINSHLQGTNTIDIVVETPHEEGVFNLEVLTRIEQLQAYAESLPHVNGSTSVVDYLKQMNKSLNEGRDAFYTLPTDEALIAQYFLLYSASGDPTDFEEEVDYDYRLANIRLRLDTAEFVVTRPVIEQLQTYIEQHFNSEEATANLSGRVNVNYHWIKDLGPSHVLSVVLALLCVCAVSALLFRSLVAGLLATAPVISSILMVYAAMALLGIDLGIGTSMFASVAIGLGVDFSIHTLDRIRVLMKAHPKSGLRDHLQAIYGSTGRALLFNYLAIAFGFGVLISSKVVPLTYFGTIVALSVTMSFLAAMTLLPALVMVIQPRFIFGQQAHIPAHKPVSALFSVMVLTGSVVLASLLFAPQSSKAVEREQAEGRVMAEQIVASVNAVDDGQQATSDLTMILTDRRGKQRTRETKSYRKYFPASEAAGQEKRTVFFYQSPKNVKGTGFLTYDYPQAHRDDDQWLYLPALRKVRRISASDRGDYFMGTDFSYEDVKLAGRVDEQDFTFTTSGRENITVDGEAISAWVVEGTPRSPEIAKELGYGKTRYLVHPGNWIIVKTDYWDEKGKHLKTYVAEDIRQIDGIWTRHQQTVTNHKTGHVSRFLFNNVNYQVQLDDALFTRRILKKGGM
ncbi:outer membrane lipoprotein-sorting protein [Endozoicomonas acroporae]|uniref:outer membrane lipoprotein-sorting protein n=1 Tax=Endozoicomonas acroporae TaxID=1701104 RepID=UPI003D7B51E0